MTNEFRYTLVLKIGDIDQFNDIATRIIAEIESEVGTLAFQMYFDEQNTKCVIYEEFADFITSILPGIKDEFIVDYIFLYVTILNFREVFIQTTPFLIPC